MINNLNFSLDFKNKKKNNVFLLNEFEEQKNTTKNQTEYVPKNPYLKKDNVPEIEIIDKNIIYCDNKEYQINEYFEQIKNASNDFLDDVIYDYCGKCKNNRNKFFCRICYKNICDKCYEACKINKHIPQSLEEIKDENNIYEIKEILNNYIIPLKSEDKIIKGITEYIDKYIITDEYINNKNSIIEDFSMKESEEKNNDIFLIYQIISKDYNNYFHIRNIEKIFTYIKEVYKADSRYKYEGYGKIINQDGEYYIGQFKNGLQNGKGIFFFKTGRMYHVVYDEYKGKGLIQHDFNKYYIGEFKNDFPNGKGMLSNKNGSKYIGDWVFGDSEGRGKYYYENGDYYIGEWKNSLINGKGIRYYKNGNIKYEGDWINGKFEGYGKYVYENGAYYLGEWKNGLMHGKGKYYYENGNIRYEGNWINDKAEGYGKLIKENGDYYIGEFKNDLIHGKGTEYYKNGNIKYEGDFKNDEVDGNGKFIYEDGNYYIGEFKNGLRHGQGIFYRKNGSIWYKGNWINNQHEGKGKYIYEDGDYYIGEWKNGLMHGRGKIYSKKEKIIYEVFSFKGEFKFIYYKKKSEDYLKFKTI